MKNMTVVTGFPPNYETLKKHFALAGNEDVIFCYGSTIYNPSGKKLEQHYISHEAEHSRNQFQIGIDKWWEQYVKDPVFRLDEELHAYGHQLTEIKKSKGRKAALKYADFFAKTLAGPVYGRAISQSSAYKDLLSISGI